MALALRKVFSQKNALFLKYLKNRSIATTTQKRNLVVLCKYPDFFFVDPSITTGYYIFCPI